jgi:hypothetical protein
MYTSVAIFAFAFVAPSPSPANLTWSQDYWAALKYAQKEQKPLAVFVGPGQKGFAKVSWEEKLTGPVQKILAEKYVCVYLDTTKKEDRRLVQDFEITKGLGFVISDRSGRHQAYHHDGGLASTDLQAKLQRFSDGSLVAQYTESNTRTSYYPTGQSYTQPAVGRSC